VTNTVTTPELPKAFQAPVFSNGVAAAMARIAAAPATQTLISQISDDDWENPVQGAIGCGKLKAPADE
jgi:hypothetical protein